MGVILITGNGFDLAHGLPTAYSDFIHVLDYIEKNEKYNFNDLYGKTTAFSFLHDKQFSLNEHGITKLATRVKSNLWFKYFKNQLEIETWIDFENRIAYALKSIEDGCEYLNHIFSLGPISEILDSYYIEDFRINKLSLESRPELVYILVTFGLISFQSGNMLYVCLNKKYLNERKYYHNTFYFSFKMDEFYKEVFKQLEDFRDVFADYIRLFVYPIVESKHLSSLNGNTFNKISKHFTFNYTKTFESLYSKKITSFLHGNVADKSQNIVLGINDLNSLTFNSELLPFTKHFQTIYNITDFAFPQEIKRLSNHNSFVLWGHSLDQSDAKYIAAIFSEVKNSETSKIAIVYHSETSRFKLQQNLFQIIEKEILSECFETKKAIFLHCDSDDLKKIVTDNMIH